MSLDRRVWDKAEYAADIVNFQAGEDTMFSARDMVPWHGQGNVVSTVSDAVEAQRLSGIEDATLEPVYIRSAEGVFVPVSDRRAVMVPSQGQPLQIVSDRYALMQPRDAFAFADTVISTGDAWYETAGSLKGQRLYWIMLRINDEIRLGPGGEDLLKPFLFLRDARDGTSAFKWSLVTERVVCRNTWRRASAEGAITSIVHRIGLEARLKEAHQVLLKARSKMELERAVVEALAVTQVTVQNVQDFYTSLLPLPTPPDLEGLKGDTRVKAEEAYEVSRMHVVRDRGTAFRLFEQGKGADLAGKTAWGLFNSVTDFVDHYRQPGAKQETVMYSSLLGVGADLKTRAMSLASDLAGVSQN